jgi:hypothetical protein
MLNETVPTTQSEWRSRRHRNSLLGLPRLRKRFPMTTLRWIFSVPYISDAVPPDGDFDSAHARTGNRDPLRFFNAEAIAGAPA